MNALAPLAILLAAIAGFAHPTLSPKEATPDLFALEAAETTVGKTVLLVGGVGYPVIAVAAASALILSGGLARCPETRT